MHPVVIMAYDKSPAINKAVAALEEAGIEVRVLNTNSAKLADFLGALAGEDTEDEEPAPTPSVEEPVETDEPDEGSAEPTKKESEEVKESLKIVVDGEEIDAIVIEGATCLMASSLAADSKTSYKLNESEYSFWPSQSEDGLFSLKHNVQIELGKNAIFVEAAITTSTDGKPLLKLSPADYAKLLG